MRIQVERRKPNDKGSKELANKWQKPLGLSGRNNGSRAHEINKWTLKRQVGLKKPGKREIVYPWAVYDVEK